MNNRFKDFTDKEKEVLKMLLEGIGAPCWNGANEIMCELSIELESVKAEI